MLSVVINSMLLMKIGWFVVMMLDRGCTCSLIEHWVRSCNGLMLELQLCRFNMVHLIMHHGIFGRITDFSTQSTPVDNLPDGISIGVDNNG